MTVALGLDGLRALVSGGTSDIGEACVRRLRDEGVILTFTGDDRKRGEAIARGTGASFIECDPRDRAATDRAVEEGLALTGGQLEVLVTHSGSLFGGSIEATPEGDFNALVEANLTSVFRTARACWQPMLASGGGSMILIASDAGIRAAHETAAYSVMSAGVIAVAELLGAEGGPQGIRANAVCPGARSAHAPGDGFDTNLSGVSALVAWLASDESTHVNGATLRIDDGAGAAMAAETRA